MAYKKKDEKKQIPSPVKGEVQKEESNFEHPVIKSYTMVRRAGGWSVATVSTQGEKVVSIEYSEPEMKAICLDRFKIKIATEVIGM